jgi:hypothetical protein
VDYDLVLLPPHVDVIAISKALSSLRLGMDEGQALESNHPGGSQNGTRPAGKPHDHRRACGQSSTAIHFDLSVGEIPVDLPTHYA